MGPGPLVRCPLPLPALGCMFLLLITIKESCSNFSGSSFLGSFLRSIIEYVFHLITITFLKSWK